MVLSSPQLHVEYWIDPGTALPARSLVGLRRSPVAAALHGGVRRVEARRGVAGSHLHSVQAAGAAEVNFRDAAGSFR